MKRLLSTCGLLLAGTLVVACSKKTEQSTSQASAAVSNNLAVASAKPTAKPAAKPPAPKHARGAMAPLAIEWKDPAEWKRVKPRGMMRKASYKVPGEGGEAELAVFYFGPGQGGSVDANIKRWTGQFKDAKKEDIQRTERSVNDLAQHIVEVGKGTFSGMRMGPHAPASGSKPDQGMLGAVVEAPSGKYFFKMTGPSKTVTRNRAAFYGLLDSIKAKSREAAKGDKPSPPMKK